MPAWQDGMGVWSELVRNRGDGGSVLVTDRGVERLGRRGRECE
jgi:hypothetical protein